MAYGGIFLPYRLTLAFAAFPPAERGERHLRSKCGVSPHLADGL